MTTTELGVRIRQWENAMADILVGMSEVTAADGMFVYSERGGLIDQFNQVIAEIQRNHASAQRMLVGSVCAGSNEE